MHGWVDTSIATDENKVTHQAFNWYFTFYSNGCHWPRWTGKGYEMFSPRAMADSRAERPGNYRIENRFYLCNKRYGFQYLNWVMSLEYIKFCRATWQIDSVHHTARTPHLLNAVQKSSNGERKLFVALKNSESAGTFWTVRILKFKKT